MSYMAIYYFFRRAICLENLRGDAKRQLHQVILELAEISHKITVAIIDEAHLLGKEMLEEIRFLLNFRMDSCNPISSWSVS